MIYVLMIMIVTPVRATISFAADHAAPYDVIPAQEQKIKARGTVDCAALTVYKQPENKHFALDVLHAGDIVELLAQKSGDGWLKIRYKGNPAYVCGKYVTVMENEKMLDGVYAIISTGILGIHRCPTTNSPLLTRLKRGARVAVIKKGVTWHQVRYGGMTGYICDPALTTSCDDDPSIQPEIKTASIIAVGDLMALNAQRSAARVSGGYDFNPSFVYAADILKSADFTVGNLETTFAGSGRPYTPAEYEGSPRLNAPDAYLDALKNAGFDLFATANNHSLDFGKAGLLRTLEQLDARGFLHTGTFTDKDMKNTPLIVTVNGINVAFISAACHFNQSGGFTSEERGYMYNHFDLSTIEKDIKAARGTGAEAVIVYVHWGYGKYDQKKCRPDIAGGKNSSGGRRCDHRFAPAYGADHRADRGRHAIWPKKLCRCVFSGQFCVQHVGYTEQGRG